LVEFEEEG
jgi:hypothetical protein